MAKELKWEKVGREVNSQGTTIRYEAAGTQLAVESRKRHIPHANRGGTWEHTSYFVLYNGNELAEKNSLAAAKEYAEKLLQ